MINRYGLVRYLAGAAAARTGDEMSGPALLLMGFSVTRAPGLGSAVLASLTGAAAAGGPAFGAMLDRGRRPGRLLALALTGYGGGITLVMLALGHLPEPAVLALATAAGLLAPAVAGGWTSRVPDVVPPARLPRASALDAMSYSAASLAGPALAALLSATLGAGPAVCVAAALIAAAVPAALSLPEAQPAARAPRPRAAVQPRAAVLRPLLAGIAAIARRPGLLRATASSVVSYVGIGMLLVCCPLLGAHRLGGASRGALLISAIAVVSLLANAALARREPRDGWILASTLILAVSLAAAALAPAGPLTVLAVAAGGVGEGPQLTAVFAVRHREAPAHLRGQIFTTAASLKIGGMAAGAAIAGPLAARSLPACLLTAAATELAAALAYLLAPAAD